MTREGKRHIRKNIHTSDKHIRVLAALKPHGLWVSTLEGIKRSGQPDFTTCISELNFYGFGIEKECRPTVKNGKRTRPHYYRLRKG